MFCKNIVYSVMQLFCNSTREYNFNIIEITEMGC